MDNEKTGRLIFTLRKERGMTQKELASLLHLSDKTVSKWERGAGCPDISLLAGLSELFGVSVEQLLQGELELNENTGGNMRNSQFYICPECGNILFGTEKAEITCCGRKLKPSEPVKASEEERLNVESVEDEWYITSDHPMTKEHYITFCALLTGDRLTMIKQYPEWNLQLRIPARGHGKLIWYCSQHGLFYQLV